jgi:hypothetical protein
MRIDYQDGTGTGNILWRMGNEVTSLLITSTTIHGPGFRTSMKPVLKAPMAT